MVDLNVGLDVSDRRMTESDQDEIYGFAQDLKILRLSNSGKGLPPNGVATTARLIHAIGHVGMRFAKLQLQDQGSYLKLMTDVAEAFVRNSR